MSVLSQQTCFCFKTSNWLTQKVTQMLVWRCELTGRKLHSSQRLHTVDRHLKKQKKEPLVSNPAATPLCYLVAAASVSQRVFWWTSNSRRNELQRDRWAGRQTDRQLRLRICSGNIQTQSNGCTVTYNTVKTFYPPASHPESHHTLDRGLTI